MPTIITDGAASAQGYGFAARTAAANYIEDVFSTYLYTGNGSTQTISNDVDLSTKGGMVWLKSRSAVGDHYLFDTSRGTTNFLGSNSTNQQLTGSTTLTAFNNNGFTLGAATATNGSGTTYTSWTFRKQAKFFDVVTYTGNGTNRTIAHNLGSVPGCIIVKRTDTTADWQVYHRSLANTEYMVLNSTAAKATGTTRWNSATPTSTVFSLGTDTTVNANGGTYVAYLFAHDAGGFGAAGSDNVISCGSFIAGGVNGVNVELGFEPQWIMLVSSESGSNWTILDNMRGWTNGGTPDAVNDSLLSANTSAAESSAVRGYPYATGFNAINLGSSTYIYIAIRRGPMKTPTSGTSVFGLSARTGTGANATVTGGQTDDAILVKNRDRVQASLFSSRLTGTGYLSTSNTAAEAAAGTTILQASPWDVMDGVKLGTTSYFTNATADTFINYLFRRAPGFFDVVCYTGTGAVLTVNHNLGVVPELMIVADRSIGQTKPVYSSALLNTEHLVLNTTAAKSSTQNVWNSTTPTATTFTLNSTPSWINLAGDNNIAYLFATCPGVSKVFSYTGNGSNQTINCGFTGGARFVLIKRTDSTGDWYVWDSARGIVAANDPHLSLNSTAAEVTTDDSVDTVSSGFIVNELAATNINVNAATYIGLAIA